MDYDTIVIGAGAAGIGAGRVLQAAGCRFTILEARPRVGGRACTDANRFGFPVDLGAQWLHSADINPLVPHARAGGFELRESSEDWGAGNASPWLSRDELGDLDATVNAFFDELDAFDPCGADAPVSALLDGYRWQSVVHVMMTHVCGAAPTQVSTADLAADCDSNVDWPIRQGMGALLAYVARDLPIRLDCPVDAIDWSGRDVRVMTRWHGSVRCRQAIVTLPTNVLASEAIAFHPQLPHEKRTALEDLPLGYNERIVVPLSGDALDDVGETFLYSSASDLDACHLHVRPFGKRCVSAYFGASGARDVAALDDEAATAVAADALASLFGNDLRCSIGSGMVTRWQHDPYALGAYSYARPGRRAARGVLAEPIADRLYFAGEATYPDHYGTVHGAFLSGEAAARSLPSMSGAPREAFAAVG